MVRVLLVDDDAGTLETWGTILRLEGFEVVPAACGATAIEFAREHRPHVVFADLRLPDMSGLDLLTRLRGQSPDTPVVVVTGFGTIRSAVEAIRRGAADYVEKPLIGKAIVRAVRRGLRFHANASAERPPVSAAATEPHAARRWARAVARMIDSPADPRTVEGWGRTIGVSRGTLKAWCRALGVSSKRSLDLARLLRAVVRQTDEGIGPEDSLDIIDRRTLTRLLSSSGTGRAALPSRIDALLEGQILIRHRLALGELRQMLSTRTGAAFSR